MHSEPSDGGSNENISDCFFVCFCASREGAKKKRCKLGCVALSQSGNKERGGGGRVITN